MVTASKILLSVLPMILAACATDAIYVLFMNADGTVKNRQKIGNELNGGPTLTFGAGFGSDIASLGDLNGDGIGDLAVGAFGEHSGAGSDIYPIDEFRRYRETLS